MYDADTLILCPYCMSRVGETASLCPVCDEDMTRDAKIEMTRAEYRQQPRRMCPHCGADIIDLAARCPACRQQT